MTDKPRAAALELLRAVREDDAYANLVMPSIVQGFGLSGRDAAFATELGYGTLRWRGWYDAVLAECLTRSLDKVEPVMLDILRLGVHQILSMRVPDHAAVDSSCVLARASGAPSAGSARAGFVNGVLRCVTRVDADEREVRLQAQRSDSDVDWLAQRWSHPAWIVRAFKDALAAGDVEGSRSDELADLLRADNVPTKPVLVARTMPIDQLLALPEVRPGRWSPVAAELVDGPPEALACVRDGSVGVQDEGSQLVTLALLRAPIDGPDRTWLDLCAGPGGKAALLDAEARRRGAHVIAVEQHEHRAELVRSALPVDSVTDVIAGDARHRPWGDALADRILVDAPCSGLGALRRRPESRWRRTPADLATLGPLQRDLLRTAVDSVRPGGVVAYVTCSPHLAETQFVVDDVLRGRTDLMQVDARAVLPEVTDCGDGPAVQLWPHRHGTDGMYVALIRKA